MKTQLIWQPQHIYLQDYTFNIILNPEFANEMFNSKLSPKNYQRAQKLPKELMNFQNP